MKTAINIARNSAKKPPGKPFQPGDPRCWRKGRPLGSKSVLSALGISMSMTLDEFKKKYGASPAELQQMGHLTLAEFLAAQDIHVGTQTVRGWAARQKIIDRLDGMPKQSMDVTSDGDPIAILVAAVDEVEKRKREREDREKREAKS